MNVQGPKNSPQNSDLGTRPGDCQLCGEPVTWEDLGFYSTRFPLHPECGTRSAVGGIGHLTDHQHWCVEMQDPDAGLGYRESARQVLQWLRDRTDFPL